MDNWKTLTAKIIITEALKHLEANSATHVLDAKNYLTYTHRIEEKWYSRTPPGINRGEKPK